MASEWMECPACGWEAVESDAEGYFFDGQEATCPNPACRATVTVSCDSESDPWTRYVCRHGADDETPCAKCKAEEVDRG